MILHFGNVEGLPEEEKEKLNYLEWIWRYHRSANRKKRRYYEGKITLGEVNLGIALPGPIKRLEIGCAWGAKTVDVLAGRSMFDGFVGCNGTSADLMDKITKRNNLISEYYKACTDELEYGCTFGVLSGTTGDARVRFYSPQSAAAAWDDKEGRIDCGFAFEDLRKDESDVNWSPAHVTFYTSTDSWVLTRDGGQWSAERYPHDFGRPLMVPMIWNATSDKPFGQSRLKEPIRHLVEGYVRTVANASIGLEFSTSPQKYLLGVTDDQYDVLISDKFKQYIGSILAATTNPETGQNPVVGQFQQGTIEPHVQMLRILATQYSAATGLSVTDTGVVNDANPTSSDAIFAQSQTLISLAQRLNNGNGNALHEIAVMAQAIELGTTPEGLTEDNTELIAHFKNPAMPSVAVTADAAIKIASVRENFAQTDVFLEMIGFDQADIRRINLQEQKARGMAVLEELEREPEQNSMEKIYQQASEDQQQSGRDDEEIH